MEETTELGHQVTAQQGATSQGNEVLSDQVTACATGDCVHPDTLAARTFALAGKPPPKIKQGPKYGTRPTTLKQVRRKLRASFFLQIGLGITVGLAVIYGLAVLR